MSRVTTPSQAQPGHSLLGEEAVAAFREGRHTRLYQCLGGQRMEVAGSSGVQFAVWAPNATSVAVMGSFDAWQGSALVPRGDGSGIWEGFLAGLERGDLYKYRIARDGYVMDKGDPFARRWEIPPGTATVLWWDDYRWGDETWMRERAGRNALDAPWSIYELHTGSWQRKADGSWPSYRELAGPLADYAVAMGYTHVEFLPLMEHPFYGSWGYQITGYFAPTARYGDPSGLKALIDHLHQRGIGVLLDWVPSHFPDDAHGLTYFDGSYLFEHADPQRGYHPEWHSYEFDYGRGEVRSFLLSSAHFWLDEFHADGLRVDGVASMLYLDYGRARGQWRPNVQGGNEDLDAVTLLKDLNRSVYSDHPDVQLIAEESTAWPMVSRPVHDGGLGFGMKWNLGWMHDTLTYFGLDPIHRKGAHDRLTFPIWYAFGENFVLPLSHDEVVYGKASLLAKMPGEPRQQMANLRLLFGYMFAHPGKKLMFMGDEIGQPTEWDHDGAIDWARTSQPDHQGLQRWVRDLNTLYRGEPALHGLDFDASGFQWIDFQDREHSVISFLRRGGHGETVMVVCNFTPVARSNYRIGVPHSGYWHEILNSDASLYGGAGGGNAGGVESAPVPAHGHYDSVNLWLPPLGILFLQPHR